MFDFILLGQIVTYIYGFISSRAVFCSLSVCVSLVSLLFLGYMGSPRKKKLGKKKHARKPFGKKSRHPSVRKSNMSNE